MHSPLSPLTDRSSAVMDMAAGKIVMDFLRVCQWGFFSLLPMVINRKDTWLFYHSKKKNLSLRLTVGWNI